MTNMVVRQAIVREHETVGQSEYRPSPFWEVRTWELRWLEYSYYDSIPWPQDKNIKFTWLIDYKYNFYPWFLIIFIPEYCLLGVNSPGFNRLPLSQHSTEIR